MPSSTTFTPVNFSQGQLLDTDTLNTLNSNSVFLRNQMVDGKQVNEAGAVTDTGIKILGGRIYLPPQNVRVVYGTIAFPALFTAGWKPVVTTAIGSPTGSCKFEHVIYGIGSVFPDHRGFQFKLKVSDAYPKAVFDHSLYFNYIAIGA